MSARRPPDDPYGGDEIVEEEYAGAPPPRRGPGDNPWLWLALLGVGVVAVVIVLIAVADGDPETEATTTAEVTAVEEEVETTTVEVETGTETETAPATVAAPDLVGLDHVDAGERAEAENLIADTFPVENDAPRGTVVAQTPEPGTEIASTRHLELAVSLGPGERPTLRVPDVTGPQAPRARAIARELGFTVLTADRDAPTAEEVGEVILQEPSAGTNAPALTQITLYVGR